MNPMKFSSLHARRAFTFVEMLVCLGCAIVLLFGVPMLLPQRHIKAVARISCLNNLKQIGISYKIWAGDNGGHFPLATSQTNGGFAEWLARPNQGANCWRFFNVMSNEMGMYSRLLICPADVRHLPSNNNTPPVFHISNQSISYFVGVLLNGDSPYALLGGDRNLAPGPIASNDFGFSPASGVGNDVILSTNPALSPLCWSLKIHTVNSPGGGGNLLMADGSVQLVKTSQLRSLQINAATTDSRGHLGATNPNSFRLIFP
jgi:prepilin-type processing-associated H-X9-DG protein